RWARSRGMWMTWRRRWGWTRTRGWRRSCRWRSWDTRASSPASGSSGAERPPPTRVSMEVKPRHLYVHAAFCARRCSYCDFAVHVEPEPPVEAWARALGGELRAVAAERGWDGP